MAFGPGYTPEVVGGPPVRPGEVHGALTYEPFPRAGVSEPTVGVGPTLPVAAGPGTVRGSARPQPGEVLVGSSTAQMRSAAARIIMAARTSGTPHPLDFLLNASGNFKPQKGLTAHDELINRPDLVQMGHIASNKLGGTEYVMLQGAWENQLNNISIERPGIGGAVLYQPAIDIGGIAVDLKTAQFWELIGWLPRGTVANARTVTF
jgi:hypothetical protein